MSYLPCKNPNCKSHGQPHPNCRCYGGLASGGDVSHFCEIDQPHVKGCEYFKDGGVAGEDPAPPPGFEIRDSEDPPPPNGFTVVDSETQESGDPPPPPGFKLEEDIKKEKYSTIPEMIKTAIEGAGRGTTLGLSDLAATPMRAGAEAIGIDPEIAAPSPEDMAARQEANPWISHGSEAIGMLGSVMRGTGGIGVASKIAEKLAPEATTVLGKIGSQALKRAIESGFIQSGNEISKAMLGHADPEAPVASAIADIGGAMLVGGFFGGLFSAVGQSASKASQKLAEVGSKDIDSRAKSFMAGFGAASRGLEKSTDKFREAEKFLEESVHKPSFNKGMEAFDFILNKGTKGVTGYVGGKIGNVPGAMFAMEHLSPYLEAVVKKPLNFVTTPVLLKVLSGTEAVTDIPQLMRYSRAITNGYKALNSGVEAIFQTGGRQAVELATDLRNREKLREQIENGELDKQMTEASGPDQMYAEGGQVTSTDNPIATHFPDQNVMLNAAKMRVSNYLTSIKPQKSSSLPFDKTHEDPQKKRSYDHALDLANKPLMILNHIKSGTLTPTQMKHFTGMYPELYNHLSKKITERITKSQVDGDRPSYKVRQSMSLFLGSPLDSSMTPGSIQAAQSVFIKSKANQQQAAEKNTKAIAKTDQSYQTGDQARLERQQKT